METDHHPGYRSRILREMTANRNNPFNSPPSSTGTASPTMSSIMSDPEGESTRRLNEDIARVTATRKLPVNWDIAHSKWPEYFSKPSNRKVHAFEDLTDTQPLSIDLKENRLLAPAAVGLTDDDSTREAFRQSTRTRAEMQPRVENESDLSSIVTPARNFSKRDLLKSQRNPSPLAKVHNRTPPTHEKQHFRRGSISEALDRLRRASASPQSRDNNRQSVEREQSAFADSAKSSLTAVQSPARSPPSHERDASHMPSLYLPDVSHLGDFVTGTLRFTGSREDGVPIFVKHGKVHDQSQKPATSASHAEVDGMEVPQDEKMIFVSMDMIRQEIISLQDHYDKVQEYAANLQTQVEEMEAELKSRRQTEKTSGGGNAQWNQHLLEQKNSLEIEVSTLQSRLEQLTRKMSLQQVETDSISQERDRAIKKLQLACEDISNLTRRLSHREKELDHSQSNAGEPTQHLRSENDTLRQNLTSLKHGRDALELENTSLRQEIETLKGDLRRNQQQAANGTDAEELLNENDNLREELDQAQDEIDTAREELDSLQKQIEAIKNERTTLQGDNENLVKHNEKYFNENKMLRRENSGFERSMHELHDEKSRLAEELQVLKDQLDHCRAVPKEDFSAKLDEQTEENMTSAFFIPDITMKTNQTAPEATQTKTKPVPSEVTGTVEVTEKSMGRRPSLSKSKSRSKSSSRVTSQSNKVSFHVPGEDTGTKSTTNKANKGSKRSGQPGKLKAQPSYQGLSELDDTTGLQSFDDITQDQAVSLSITGEIRNNDQDTTNASQRVRPQSRMAKRQPMVAEVTSDSVRMTSVQTCPALSVDARRVLDNLCEHNCKNCTVCARITSHGGIFSRPEVSSGKKRVTVPRPVPVTDRDITAEDATMRPVNSPGHALAVVIKGLEDESRHLQMELSRLQARYNESDKALGRKDRVALAESIRTILKTLEAKNDQIYSLYDVLEGQKVAGQVMTEAEIDMTVMNITGMSIKDLTAQTDLTWDGVPEIEPVA